MCRNHEVDLMVILNEVTNLDRLMGYNKARSFGFASG
jgi:hypothetical protein